MFSSNASNSTHLFVRSNIHMANLDAALKKNLSLQKFVDVTISCEGRIFKCHRLILAAASPLFENLFIDNPAQHPIVIIPLGIRAWTIQALIDFMYKGHVNVSQCGLKELVRSAELLQISGLNSARKNMAEYCHKDDGNGSFGDGGSQDLPEHKETEKGSEQQHYNDIGIAYDGRSDNNDTDGDGSDDYDECEGFKEGSADNHQEHIESGDQPRHHESGSRFDITSESDDTIMEIIGGEQSPEIDYNDADRIYTEEHNDSGLPASPPTNSLSTKHPLESTYDTVGKIRVKSRVKLFDRTATTTTTKAKSKKDLHVSETALKSMGMRPMHMKAEDMDFEAERIICQPSMSYICNAEGDASSYTNAVAVAVADGFNCSSSAHGKLLEAMLMQSDPNLQVGDYEGAVTGGPIAKGCSKFSKTHQNKHDSRQIEAKTQPTKHVRLPTKANCCIASGKPSLHTVILRSPRSNQPRSYSNEALYDALMAVKHGKSIYRASREYQVPRKTLRNWMKRWDIKSQFPMPKQLKDAATKKKLHDVEQQM